MDLVGPRLPLYQGDLILAAICAGVLLGIGYAIIFMRGSSTGGFDFIMMAIKYYHPHLSLGKIAFAMDTLVIVTGGFLIGSGNAVIYGLLLNYLYSTVLDKVIYGTSSGKLTLIITDYAPEMVTAIDRISGRGATILNASGGYSGESKPVVMCASNNKEMYAIRKCAHEVDPKAFVIIVESNEVIGEGFSFNTGRYTAHEIAASAHPHELPESHKTVLNLDYGQSGSGSNACGPELLKQYRLDQKEFTMELAMRPIQK